MTKFNFAVTIRSAGAETRTLPKTVAAASEIEARRKLVHQMMRTGWSVRKIEVVTGANKT